MLLLRRPRTTFTLATAAAVALAIVVSGCGGNSADSPTTQSPLPVGRTAITLTDNLRTEVYGPTAGGPRKLGVLVWYPAADGGASASGPMLSADIAGQIEIATGIPASVISNLPTASRIEADIRPGKARYPVVVMSHGNGGFAIESSSAAERLASKGYVVVGVTHTGNAAFSVLDGEVIPGDPSARVDGITPAPGPSSTFGEFAEYRANVIAQSKTYIRDLQFVLDELQILNATDVRLKGRLDLDHIGVFGFSYGASHAFGALREDSRIDAAAGVDGTIWHEQFKDGSPKPYLVFTGERLTAEEEQAQIETFLGMGYSATEAQQAHDWTRSDILAHMASPNSVRVSIPKARHFNFTDLGIWRDYGFPADDISEEVPPASLLKSYQDYLVAFFEENLKGRYQGILHQASTDPNATVSRSR